MKGGERRVRMKRSLFTAQDRPFLRLIYDTPMNDGDQGSSHTDKTQQTLPEFEPH